MSEFLVQLLSGIASSVVDRLIGWWDRKQLEAEAARARALEQQVEAIKDNRLREERLREELCKDVQFSYEAWKAEQ